MTRTTQATKNSGYRKAVRGKTTKAAAMPDLKFQVTKTDIFVWFDGKKIAKRGKPGTPEAGTWVSLLPGYEVYGTDEIQVHIWEPRK